MTRTILRFASLFLMIVVSGCQVKTPDQTDGANAKTATSETPGTSSTATAQPHLPAFSTAAYANKVVLLDFWAPWNAQSMAELPVMKKLHQDLQSQPFTVVGLAVERSDQAAAAETIRGLGLPYPVSFASDELLKSFGNVRAMPTRILLDKRGAVRKQYAGLATDTKMREDITALLAEP